MRAEIKKSGLYAVTKAQTVLLESAIKPFSFRSAFDLGEFLPVSLSRPPFFCFLPTDFLFLLSFRKQKPGVNFLSEISLRKARKIRFSHILGGGFSITLGPFNSAVRGTWAKKREAAQ